MQDIRKSAGEREMRKRRDGEGEEGMIRGNDRDEERGKNRSRKGK